MFLAACTVTSTTALHMRPPTPRLQSSARMVAAPSVAATTDPLPTFTPLLSGLNGKALDPNFLDYIPSKGQVRAVVPNHCYKRQTWRSMLCLAQSVVTTALAASLGLLIPLKAIALPLWIAYAAFTGTVAMGLWVLAHECGHGAFSDNRWLQDFVGFVLHSALLVPYFSWQRSHAVHHSRTNHIYEGETHVPTVVDGIEGECSTGGEVQLDLANKLGEFQHACYQIFGHLTIGWPSYILFGLTGGGKYGTPTNHFVANRPFNTDAAIKHLWPNKWPQRVLQSSAGVMAVLALLWAWSRRVGAATVWAFYGGPYLVVNMWLIIYTWLQHTDVDVPHLGKDDFTYMRGAFHTIDRPYPPVIDWLHHRIGSTHVAHHIDCTIPHYHAQEATRAIAAAFPEAYLHEPTPVHLALWRVAKSCIAVKRRSAEDSRFVFVPLSEWRK